jgi:heme/copper-type cytochrome/quinol oxidase subunit 4
LTDPGGMERGALMHSDPRFWAVFVAIWLGMGLALINIAVKIHMFLDLAQSE